MDLPPGWESVTDGASGKPYYFNRSLGITQWDLPGQSPPPPPPPPPPALQASQTGAAGYAPQPAPPTSAGFQNPAYNGAADGAAPEAQPAHTPQLPALAAGAAPERMIPYSTEQKVTDALGCADDDCCFIWIVVGCILLFPIGLIFLLWLPQSKKDAVKGSNSAPAATQPGAADIAVAQPQVVRTGTAPSPVPAAEQPVAAAGGAHNGNIADAAAATV